MTVPASVDYKFVLQLTTLLLYAVIAGSSLYGAATGRWDLFAVCAPFGIVVWPGYLELLPLGGLRHGSSCDCKERDTECELGFWIERGQRLALFLPPVLSSIFLSSVQQNDLSSAISHTAMAALTALGYFLLCALGVLILARTR